MSIILYHCGIPQGSVLGPVLFLMYINDLPDNVASNVFMFADDTEIYCLMTSHEDTTIPQNDLDCMHTWSAKWLLNFILHKCKVMSITKSTVYSHDTTDYYPKNLKSRITYRHCWQANFPNQLNLSNRLLGGGATDAGTAAPTSASVSR